MISRAKQSGWTMAVLMLTAAAAHGASIDLGSASGPRGADVSITVTLHTMGAGVLGTQNRIEFDRATPIAADAFGVPDCEVNPVIHKDATGFRFLPIGCDPAVDCTAVRVLLLAFANLDPIPDGAVLYMCHIVIASDASFGPHVLINTETNASAVNGGDVATSGSNGVVTVESEPVATIDVGTGSGPPGSLVDVPVRLNLIGTPAAQVASVTNDIAFDVHTPVLEVDGEPACSVDPGLDKGASSFAFLPLGCTPGASCSGVRATIADSAEPTAIADGATLYDCQFAIAPGTPAGTAYALAASNGSATDVTGTALPVLTSDGAVEVVPPPPPPCVGDCNGDHLVVINELLIGVNIAIGREAVTACPVIDVNDDNRVTVDELIRAVNNALSGCPSH